MSNNPNPPNDIFAANFDVSQGPARFSPRDTTRSLILETFADGNGNLSGTVAVYLGVVTGGPPWRELNLANGDFRCSPIPSVETIFLVPSSGAKGIVGVITTPDILGLTLG